MPKNNNPTFRTSSIPDAWTDIRQNFGPTNVLVGSEIYAHDIAAWTAWSASHGISDIDAFKFGRWLIWLCLYGTSDFGNLPSHTVSDHVGHCWAPCPFDSTCYTPERSIGWIGYDPATLNDHGKFYLKTMYHGVWGLECTFAGCPYLLANGRPYFHV